MIGAWLDKMKTGSMNPTRWKAKNRGKLRLLPKDERRKFIDRTIFLHVQVRNQESRQLDH